MANEVITKADLPSLQPRQHAFVDAWYRSILGELKDDDGNEITTWVGIREAAGYSVEGMTRANQYCDAWKIRTNAKVQQWMQYLLQEHRECTLDSHLERLNRLGMKAERNGDITNARLCETARAEAAGIKQPARHEHLHVDVRTEEDVRRYLSETFGQIIDITPTDA